MQGRWDQQQQQWRRPLVSGEGEKLRGSINLPSVWNAVFPVAKLRSLVGVRDIWHLSRSRRCAEQLSTPRMHWYRSAIRTPDIESVSAELYGRTGGDLPPASSNIRTPPRPTPAPAQHGAYERAGLIGRGGCCFTSCLKTRRRQAEISLLNASCCCCCCGYVKRSWGEAR